MATRVFAYDGRRFPDPNPTLSVDEVKSNMASFFPELATAEVKQHADEKDKETTIFEFSRKTGTKA